MAKCGGLPKVIAAVAEYYNEFLETGKLKYINANFMQILEGLPSLNGVFSWMQSYLETCEDDLKPCIFYLPVFPIGHVIRFRRLLWRWNAEGYFRGTSTHTAEENGMRLLAELWEFSMIQLQSSKRLQVQVNGFFHEYITSRAMEDNLVFALEGDCSPDSQRAGQHLSVRNLKDTDCNVYGSTEFSRLRSLTVFGECRPFMFDPEKIKMRHVRVLDLEDASGVRNIDLDHIVELLPRLKFLSIRGCREITRLPKSLGGLRQLQTLDVRDTSVVTLPYAILKLQKLQYVRAGTIHTAPWDEGGIMFIYSLATPVENAPTAPEEDVIMAVAAQTTLVEDAITASMAPADAAAMAVAAQMTPGEDAPMASTAPAEDVTVSVAAATAPGDDASTPPSMAPAEDAAMAIEAPMVTVEDGPMASIAPAEYATTAHAGAASTSTAPGEDAPVEAISIMTSVVLAGDATVVVASTTAAAKDAPAASMDLAEDTTMTVEPPGEDAPTGLTALAEDAIVAVDAPTAPIEDAAMAPTTAPNQDATVPTVAPTLPAEDATTAAATPPAQAGNSTRVSSPASSEDSATDDSTTSAAAPRSCPNALIPRCLSKLCCRQTHDNTSRGVEVPAGIGKLTTLHTIGVANVGLRKAVILKELHKLTQLRRLGVCGIRLDNIREFFSAIKGLNHLKQLSVRLEKDKHGLLPSLDNTVSRPPKTLEQLKLHGHVRILPGSWIKDFVTVDKLDLQVTLLQEQQDMQVILDQLGGREELSRSRLCIKPIHDGELLIVRNDGQMSMYLDVLEIVCPSDLLQVTIGDIGRVKVVKVHCSNESLQLSGLQEIEGLKEVWLKGSYSRELIHDLLVKLAQHKDKPELQVLKPHTS